MSAVDPIGAALGEAACIAEDALCALVRMALRLDAAGIDIADDVVAEVIEAVADMSAGLTRLADYFGHAEVERGAARRGAAA